MSKEPILETERLILRPITLDDAKAAAEAENVARVMAWISL